MKLLKITSGDEQNLYMIGAFDPCEVFETDGAPGVGVAYTENPPVLWLFFSSFQEKHPQKT